MMMEHHRNAGIRSQSFAAGAGREKNAGQIDGCRADRADAIEAKPGLSFSANGFERVQIIEHAAGSFAMGAPEPARRAFQSAANRVQIKGTAPRKFQRLKIQPEPSRLVDQPIPKLAVAQDESAFRAQGKLSRN